MHPPVGRSSERHVTGGARLVLLLALGLACSSVGLDAVPAGVLRAQTPGTTPLRLAEVGDIVHWDGPTIERAAVPDRRACQLTGPCWEYDLDVGASRPGAALRIAATMTLADSGDVRAWADFPAKSPEMLFELQLYAPGSDPAGDPLRHGENGRDGMHGYSRELTVGGIDADGRPLPAPAMGTWLIRIIPKSVSQMSVRLRAALHDETATPTGPQLPDLRFTPPFEITLGTAAATGSPGATAIPTGLHPSCMAEELAEAVTSGHDLPGLCLRFTMGLENVGTGTFDLVWHRPADEGAAATQLGGATMRRQLQRVCDFFGKSCAYLPDRGISTLFHWGHAHEHWVDAWSVELHRIPDPARRDARAERDLAPIASARKLGINPYPELIADWDRVWPLSRPPQDPTESDGCFADDGGSCTGAFPIQLEAGYADLYEWNRGGNYVELPQGARPLTPQPGWYLLRATADPRNLVAESDERNNDSYAVFAIAEDGTISLKERGYGADPWTGRRTVLHRAP